MQTLSGSDSTAHISPRSRRATRGFTEPAKSDNAMRYLLGFADEPQAWADLSRLRYGVDAPGILGCALHSGPNMKAELARHILLLAFKIKVRRRICRATAVNDSYSLVRGSTLQAHEHLGQRLSLSVLSRSDVM